jgi:hypothetical protein
MFTRKKQKYMMNYKHTIVEHLFLFSCFLKYESFSSWQQSYFRNIGYFEGIYTCENLTFHLQTEKEVQFVSENYISMFTRQKQKYMINNKHIADKL